MKFEFALLADAAVAADGKLYIHGGNLTRLMPPGFPFLLPQLAVIVVLSIDDNEPVESHSLTIAMHGPTGEQVFPPVVSEFKTVKPEHTLDDEEVHTQIVASFGPLPIVRPGTYRVAIAIDDAPVQEFKLPAVAAQRTGDEPRPLF